MDLDGYTIDINAAPTITVNYSLGYEIRASFTNGTNVTLAGNIAVKNSSGYVEFCMRNQDIGTLTSSIINYQTNYPPLRYGACYDNHYSIAHYLRQGSNFAVLYADDIKMGYYAITLNGAMVLSGTNFEDNVTAVVSQLPFEAVQRTDACVSSASGAEGRRLIGGGDEIEDGGAYRFVGSLGNFKWANDSHGCGASLIASNLILTAAHCFTKTVAGWPYYNRDVCENTCAYDTTYNANNGQCDDNRGTGYCKLGSDCQDCGTYVANYSCNTFSFNRVLLGVTDRTYEATDICAERIPLKRAHEYPAYAQATNSAAELYFLRHDLAIVTLAGSSAYPPIPLYNGTSTDLLGADVVAIGWGATENSPLVTNKLRKVRGVIQCVGTLCHNSETQYCVYATNYNIDDMLCVRYGTNNEGGACSGDSGGPVVLIDSTTEAVLSLVGVISFMTESCGMHQARYYAMNIANVEHRHWLHQFV